MRLYDSPMARYYRINRAREEHVALRAATMQRREQEAARIRSRQTVFADMQSRAQRILGTHPARPDRFTPERRGGGLADLGDDLLRGARTAVETIPKLPIITPLGGQGGIQGYGTAEERAEANMTPTVPQDARTWLEQQGAVGQAINRNVVPLTAPAVATGAIFAPGLVLGGTAGATGGSLAGRFAETELGAPENIAGTGIGFRSLGEGVGGVTGGGLETQAGRAALKRGASAGLSKLPSEEAFALSDDVFPQGFDEVPPSFSEPEPVKASPRASRLKTIEEIQEDASEATKNYVGGATRVAGNLPPVRGVLDAINPSAYVDAPPKALVDELGEEGASRLQGALLGYRRKVEQAASLTAAIDDGVRQRARQVGFAAKDGLLINNKGLSAPVGDVFENPNRYKAQLTPDQRAFIDEVAIVLDDVSQAEKAAGVAKGEVFSEEGRYFPRSVIESRGTPNLRRDIPASVGVKQKFQKGRFYETQEEGIAAGVNYSTDIAALVGTRVRAGIRAIADKELAAMVKPYGRTVKPDAPVGLGEMGTTIPAFGGRVFPREASTRLLQELSPRPAPGGVFGAANAVNAILVPLRATGDLSYTLLQALSTAYRNFPAFLKATGYGIDSLVTDGRLYGKYVQANSEAIERFVRSDGIWGRSELTFQNIAQNNVARKAFAPFKAVTGRFDASFNNTLNVAALENFKAMAGVSEVLGPSKVSQVISKALGNISGETSEDVAASIANKMTGRLSSRSLGVGATQRETERLVAFAPNFYRANLGLLGDAIQGGMRGAEARRVLLQFIAGTVATYTAVAYALGQEPKLDPRRSDLMTVKINGTNVGFGGPMHGLIRTMAEVSENPTTVEDFNMENPVARWARGRLSPVLGIAVDLVSGTDFLGNEIDRSAEGIAQHVGKGALPFSAQSIEEGPTAAVAQFFGGRAFPVSPFEQLNEARATVMQERGIEGSFDDLKAADSPAAAEIDQDPRVQEAFAAIEESEANRPQDDQDKFFDLTEQSRGAQNADQLEDDNALESGVMAGDVWRERFKDRQQDMYNQREGIKQALGIEFAEKESKGTVNTAIAAYFDVNPETFTDEAGETDWDGYFAARETALAPLSDKDKQRVMDFIHKYDTPVVERFRTANDLKDQYYETPKWLPAIKDQDKLEEIHQLAEQKGLELANRGMIDAESKLIYALVGRDISDAKLAYKAYLIRPGSKMGTQARNPARMRFLIDNAKELRVFFPDLYANERTQLFLGLSTRAPSLAGGALAGSSVDSASQERLATVP